MALATLKKDINDKCRNNTEIISALATLYDVHVNSVQRWFREDSDKLTNIDTLAIISEHLRIPANALTVSNKSKDEAKATA